MIPQTLSTPSFSPLSLPLKPSLISVLKPITLDRRHKKLLKRKLRNGTCRAEFSADTPIAVAIGASILNSLVFPIPSSPEDDDEGDSLIDSADARFAVMGIISFIPYFNWLSWLFAWLDTGERRYAVYAIVYLAPYLRCCGSANEWAMAELMKNPEDLKKMQEELANLVGLHRKVNENDLDKLAGILQMLPERSP